MNQNHQIVGQLHGGQDIRCESALKASYYGRFDKSWDYGNVATRRLKDWLDPGNTGITQLEARDIEIVGDDIICDSSVYYVDGLPSNMNVVWEYLGTSAPMPVIQVDYPVKNQCIIRNMYKYPLDTTLKAKITQNGNVIIVLTKQVLGDNHSSEVKGTYTQEACTFYNVSHPSISGTLKTGQSTFVHQGCMVHVKLNEINKDVYLSNTSPQPLYWHYDKATRQLDFQLPYSSGGIPYTFFIGGKGACQQKYMVFFSISNNGNASNYSMKVNLSDSHKDILITSNKRVKPQNILYWDLEVYNTAWGMKVFEMKDIKTKNYSIETSGWTSGTYVVRAIIGDEALTETITVEK